MRMYDLIMKKRNGKALSEKEIRYIIEGYVTGSIPDYQMSAFLMAVYFKGMTDEETAIMTDAVARSGDMVDLSGIAGIKVDKHSTGGVGDKTTLIIAPIAAACGVKVAKMSGRGLGHTGGTIDKMEAIPGIKTSLTQEEFFDVVNQTGLSVIGQSGNITPADKKLYALRDVTATVDSIPLIAVSIMSKKLAAGSDCILLDVKTGSGAFMKTLEESIKLAECMVAIGENSGRKTAALITDMDRPLGNNIGNSLEVIEAVETLKGNGPEDLTEVCLSLAANMLYLGGKGELSACMEMAKEAIQTGKALENLIAMVEAQGGDASVIKDPLKFEKAALSYEVKAPKSGYITYMDTEACGIASMMLGAGRETKDSVLDYAAGIILVHKTGDYVEEGAVLATLYAGKKELFESAGAQFIEAVTITDQKTKKEPLIFARIEKGKVERYL
ncbi:pyrimidine-nucleoside phosphorylase [Cellulosilyticum sp. I15G10I2]|uniref:pyrimidine-nucleoside phosphorylase n=1 Tax=Cellulosilyticum sp. I15G10I2 TaxID=1892843 RepID=UPI00085C9943|nr:pyrimidine-nucleoside phosphorylase [Cellulosilyticum sp. I15G10I2]